VLSYELEMVSEAKSRWQSNFTGTGSEAVEISQNFHGLLHGFTLAALGAEVK
jgi:hypothetical protein